MRESGQIWGHETFTHVSEQQERGTETQAGRGEQGDQGDGGTAIRERRTGTQGSGRWWHGDRDRGEESTGSGRGRQGHRYQGEEYRDTGIRERRTGELVSGVEDDRKKGPGRRRRERKDQGKEDRITRIEERPAQGAGRRRWGTGIRERTMVGISERDKWS
jgi:hypothetical protein